MGKDRSETGRYKETTTLDGVLGVFNEVRGPIVTSADVADELGCSRDTARRKLAELHRNERVDRRETAGRVVWWIPPDATADERGASAGARKVDSETGGSGRRTTEAAQNADMDAREQTGSADVSDVIGALDLPGSGKKLEARREAVRACVEALRSWECGWPADFKEQVYPHYPAYHEQGDDPANAWWKNTVYPGFREIAERTGAIESADTSGMWEWSGE
jgi:biotin operon repressor